MRTTAVCRTIESRRASRVTVLLLGIIVLSIADLAVTLAYLQTTGMLEANPIAEYLIRTTDSSWALGIYKMTTVAIAVTVLWYLRRRLEGEVASWCGISILVGVSFLWHGYAVEFENPEDVMLARSGVYGESWLVLD
jgi:hypothetical protein